MNKKSQSNIIAIVLIILLVLAAVIVVYNIVIPMVRQSGEQVKINVLENQVNVAEVSFKDTSTQVKVTKTSGNDKISALKFIFYYSSGASSTAENTSSIPNTLETFTYNFDKPVINLTGDKIVKVSVIPVFEGKIGVESSQENVKDSRNLFYNGNAETGNTDGWKYVSINNTYSHSGTYSFFNGTTRISISSNDFIQIDPTKKYYEEGWFWSNGTLNSTIYYGFVPYDQNKIQIYNYNVNPIPNTETTLYSDSHANDKLVNISITNCVNWKNVTSVPSSPFPYYRMAFNVDIAGNYNDLPNYNLSSYNITRVTNKGAYCEVEFYTPVGINALKGTNVREHTDGNGYMYNAAKGASVPKFWQNFNATITGESLTVEDTDPIKGNWRRGTRYVRGVILANYNSGSGQVLFIDDLKFVQVD